MCRASLWSFYYYLSRYGWILGMYVDVSNKHASVDSSNGLGSCIFRFMDNLLGV